MKVRYLTVILTSLLKITLFSHSVDAAIVPDVTDSLDGGEMFSAENLIGLTQTDVTSQTQPWLRVSQGNLGAKSDDVLGSLRGFLTTHLLNSKPLTKPSISSDLCTQKSNFLAFLGFLNQALTGDSSVETTDRQSEKKTNSNLLFSLLCPSSLWESEYLTSVVFLDNSKQLSQPKVVVAPQVNIDNSQISQRLGYKTWKDLKVKGF